MTKVDHGLKLLEIGRLSRRHTYIDDNGGIRIYCDPMFDDEKERLQMLVGSGNKRKLLEELKNHDKIT